jgi:predicted ATPase/DNA-binding SARP family transcriptional activator
LMAYLAIEHGGHQRAALSALLWPDYDQSRAYKNLRQTVWEIQQAAGADWLAVTREKIGLNGSADIHLDISDFDTLLEKSHAEPDVSLRAALLADSVKIYRHHFLTGFSLKDAQPFNDWAYAVSEELRRKLSNALTTLTNDYCSLGQANQAIPYARRLVSLDPLDESAHGQLMEVYLQAGQDHAALKQYQTLEQTLRRELNLDPQPETRELYKRIRKGEAKPAQIERKAETSQSQHNLPHQLSSFIGRTKEQAEIRNLIQKNRLVTLVGAGGIGKTSLSLQVAHSLLGNHPDGIWFIGLDSLSDPALTVQTVASVFDVREGTKRPLADKLTDVLRNRNTLLIFDNCEHLLDACAGLITSLLARCPNLKVLATSREELGITGEAVYTMPSLPLPEPGEDSLETLTEYESVRLFAERAALALTSFQLTRENIQAVVDICRKVDGIPLAIELAAARVNIMQVEEILKQVSHSFALLAKDSHTIMPRHQTIRASLEWSWSLLDDEEQTFLWQLSVFAGGWTLDAAQAICDGDVLGLTGALVKKSLIVVNQESGRETRYRFHEMVRQFVSEKCVESGDEEEIRKRHLKYFLDLSEQARRALRGPSRTDWMERLDDERNDLRAALIWADHTDLEAGLYLSGRLLQYWESLNLREGRQWCENFLRKSRPKDFPLARAYALHAYGWLLSWLQDFAGARAATQESLKLFRAAKYLKGEVDALILMGSIEQFYDDPRASRRLLTQAIKLAISLNDPWREANAYYMLGWDHSDYQRKFAHWERSIHLFREVGDQIALANLLGLTGQFRVLNGEFELAEKYLDEAMQLWETNRKANTWDNPKIAKGLIASTQGRYEEARVLLEEVLESSEQTGNLMAHLWAKVRLGYVAFHEGSLVEARGILAESTRSFTKDNYTIGVVYSMEGLAGLYATLGKTEIAAILIGFADATREKISDIRPPLEQADVDMSIAACIARSDKSAFAKAYEEGKGTSMEDAVKLAIGED